MTDLSMLGKDPQSPFPPASDALEEPNGLLTFGGDLHPARLLNAYRRGIFPWYSGDQPILWWCPNPRAVFRTDTFRLSSRFRRSLRTSTWHVRADTAFEAVIDACAATPRHGQNSTWITREMRDAYLVLHQLGHAHSIEVFADDVLTGGLYGVAIGQMFFGESMVSLASGGSKVALGALAYRLHDWGWPLIDGQVENDHLLALGAERWPRSEFLAQLASLVDAPGRAGSWTEAFGHLSSADLAINREQVLR